MLNIKNIYKDNTCNTIHRCMICRNIKHSTNDRYTYRYYIRCSKLIETKGSKILNISKNYDEFIAPISIFHICADRYVVEFPIVGLEKVESSLIKREDFSECGEELLLSSEYYSCVDKIVLIPNSDIDI